MASQSVEGTHFSVAEYERGRILQGAEQALQVLPQAPSMLASPVSGVDKRAYVSQSTEWFKNAATGKYEHRVGYTNEAAFTAHRDALVAMNAVVAACVAAWRLSGEQKYATHAMRHLRGWFMDSAVSMEPSLEHAGSIDGSADGHYSGVEETVMLAETMRAAAFLFAANGVGTDDEATALRGWCGAFAAWLNESKKGTIAREAKDQAAICWTLQAAECARFARLDGLQRECSHRFRDKLVRLMNVDGQFDFALHRADAFASSIFTLDCLATACQAMSTTLDPLWEYTLPDGRGMRSACAFLHPALENRNAWKFPADPEHFSALPTRSVALLFAGRAFSREEYVATWKRLPPEPAVKMLLRRQPIRQASLWTIRPPA